MAHASLITEAQLDDWVVKHEDDAPKKIVELVSHLTVASCPNATYRHFSLRINQQGPDGELLTEVGFRNFVPEGRSFWQFGTGKYPGNKATSDYKDLTDTVPVEVRKQSSFIFVTPRSSATAWPNTWKSDGIATWTEARKHLDQWKDVRVINGAIIADWLTYFPGIMHEMAGQLLGFPLSFETAESRWELLCSYGSPPPLTHHLFTTQRDRAAVKLQEILVEQQTSRLRLETRYPKHAADYVAAFLNSLEEGARGPAQSRILIFQNEDGWQEACAQLERHVLIPDFDVDSDRGGALIQQAISARHAVIHSGLPGGPPHGNSVELVSPKASQLKTALVEAGYSEERARTLTNHSGNDLSALLRLIQGLSAMPEWATKSDASDLAVAQLLGQWEDESPGDQEIASEISGKEYEEWIKIIRRCASAPAAPLEYFGGRWKFTSRYEPWVYLGRQIGPDVLSRFQEAAIKVLGEADPELDLAQEQRHAAGIIGQKRRYSARLREGMAETLALLGAHGGNLSSCTEGRPAMVSSSVVASLLNRADSKQWSSLNDVLPLLAEAAPGPFLNAVGGASERPDEPFSGVFAEEGGGIFGHNYATGLLWALEALAWSSDYVVRVCGILANLAAVDPGGRFANRPANSIVTILLPWLPQTCASPDFRHAAMQSVKREQPEVAWKVLLQLLPQAHGASFPTHKPKWLNIIPEDWKAGVTNGERWADEAYYAMMTLKLADNDPVRLAELLDPYFFLNLDFQRALREHLQTPRIMSLPDHQRLSLWTELTVKVSNHRKFADSPVWTVPETALQELEEVAAKLKPVAPEVFHKRLFSGREADLYEEKDNWEKQRDRLLERRKIAIREILDRSGFENLKGFWHSAESPFDVGLSYGLDSERANDLDVFPGLLESAEEPDRRFVTGYVCGRFSLGQWAWVDSVDRAAWTDIARAEFIAALPFVNDAWERVLIDLPENQSPYWKRARVHPDRRHPDRMDFAIEKLIENGRPDAAIECFWLCNLYEGSYAELGLRALGALTRENRIDGHAIGELFKHLQEGPSVDEERLAAMEVRFLELLNPFGHGLPRTLYRHLAERPEFFWGIIKLVYRSKTDAQPSEEESEPDEERVKSATRAYRLLHDWDHPPGRLADGPFDAQRLNSWFTAVREKCLESGHWEVASNHIGEVLLYAPREEGLWIEPVCELLNLKEEEHLRRGLQIRIYNSRGAHTFTGGKEEIDIAEDWERIARLADQKGLARLGTALREIGKSYRAQAEHSVAEHQHLFD